MKKALKVTALIIAIISMFTLIASAQDKTIEWNYGYEYSETYSYGGELKIGNNKVAPVSKPKWYETGDFRSEYVYYEFDVEKSGYYSIDILGDLYYTHYMPAVSQDIRDGVVYGEKEYLFLDDYRYSVYLEEGDCIFGIDFFIYEPAFPDGDYSGELNIEFIAEKITDVQIDDDYLEDIIFGYHIDPEYDENNTTYIPAKGRIVFENGKEYEFNQYLDIEYPDDIAPGESKITFVIDDFKKEYTVLIKTVDDYIENIEIDNIEEVAVVTQTFLPDVAYSPDVYYNLIVTKPDGTKITEEDVYYIYDIQLKGEKSLTIWFDHIQDDDGKWYFVAEAGYKEYLKVPCKSVPASFEQNYILFIGKVAEYTFVMIDEFSMYISDAFGLLSGLSIAERSESFSDAFASIGNCYSEIYNLTEMFVDYVK